MKKLFGISILSTMLLLGQPIMVLADIPAPGVINFEDIDSIIAERNIDIQINKNSNLKDKADLSTIRKTIKDLEDDLDDIEDQKDQASTPGELIPLNAGKRILLDALKEAERGAADKPTLEAIIDLSNEMNDDSIVLSAEGIFIGYNQLNMGISSLSSNIETMQKKLSAMELQESLGMISHNNVSNLKTALVSLKTQLESTKSQQEALERQFRNLLNDQENSLTIGSIPAASEKVIVEDAEADLEVAMKNSYAIKLQELQITILQSSLDRAKKDNGASSKEYKKANYDLINANLKLNQLKDGIKLSYNTMMDNISNLQSELQLAEQILADKKVALSEAQLKMGLGLFSKLELDDATKDYKVQENAVKAKQIDLFNAKLSYEWFLKGMALSN